MPVNANANSGTQKATEAGPATETAARAGFDAARDTLQTGVDTAVQSFQRIDMRKALLRRHQSSASI